MMVLEIRCAGALRQCMTVPVVLIGWAGLRLKWGSGDERFCESLPARSKTHICSNRQM